MRRALTTFLAAGALAVAGCGGGDDKADYEKEVQAAGKALEESFGDIGTSLGQSGSSEQAAEKLEEGADALDKAADDLKDADPPSEVEDPHSDVVEALGELADEFREGSEAAKSGNVEALVQFSTNLQGSDAVKKLQAAGEQFEEKGYDFGGS